mmetsp:Transcript_6279/g.13627  ORF Transcript_6279/g.13627 Transcript_6279/m.13627 type:complete len:113 (+) Transcript_6279:394-732(+)
MDRTESFSRSAEIDCCSTFYHLRRRERIFFTQHKYSLSMREISSNVLFEDQVCQDALYFVQINGHSEPLKTSCNHFEANLLFPYYFVNPLEKVSITNHLTFLEEQIGTSPDK